MPPTVPPQSAGISDPAVASRFSEIETDIRDVRSDVSEVRNELASVRNDIRHNHFAIIEQLGQIRQASAEREINNARPKTGMLMLVIAVFSIIQGVAFFIHTEAVANLRTYSDQRSEMVMKVMEEKAKTTDSRDLQLTTRVDEMFALLLQNEKNARYWNGYNDAERYHTRKALP